MINIKSIGLFIDGGYFAKINEALDEKLSLNINLKTFISFIREEIAKRNNINIKDCHITENHYYRGRYRVSEANNKKLLYSERKFEDSLIENDIVCHYKHLRSVENDGKITTIEKGIDVWFALEAYELSRFRNFDFIVLITGDADHEMLVKKLKALKIHVILLTWDVLERSSTAKLLREEACTHIELNNEISDDKELLNKLCQMV